MFGDDLMAAVLLLGLGFVGGVLFIFGLWLIGVWLTKIDEKKHGMRDGPHRYRS